MMVKNGGIYMKQYGMIATWKMSLEGMRKAKLLLSSGASVKEAILATIMDVENQPNFHSVGYGGLPNKEGVVELDAAYMNGDNLSFGAISGVHDIKNPIVVAEDLSNHMRNCYLTASGAEQYAVERGFERREMLTDEAKSMYQQRKHDLHALSAYDGHDTVCVIGKDASGSMAVGVSTSGLFMKHPGRVGDSPVIGSGYYCDSQVGGAAATGMGEDIMKGCLSIMIVNAMRNGLSVQSACEEVLNNHCKRMQYEQIENGSMSVIAMDKDGNFGAATTEKEFPFVVLDEHMDATIMVCENKGKMRVFEADAMWLKNYGGD